MPFTQAGKFSGYWEKLIRTIHKYDRTPAKVDDICSAAHQLEKFTLELAEHESKYERKAKLLAESLNNFRSHFAKNYREYDSKQTVARQLLLRIREGFGVGDFSTLEQGIRNKDLIYRLAA